jgi:hypothetical protein
LSVPQGYREEELVTNRASLLLSGGTEEERRVWAAAAAHHFVHEGPLVEVRQAPQLAEALKRPRGVVYIPDVTKLGIDAQGTILRCLQMQEERPKLVLGVSGSLTQAREKGLLREDLHYRLHRAQVDLHADGMREVLARRRTVVEAAEAARKVEEARVAAEKAAALKAQQSRNARLRSRVAPRATSPKRVTGK